MKQINITTRYGRSLDFDFQTRLERINLDEERVVDTMSGNGFIIDSPKAIKDDMKNPNGIYSTKFGPGLQDINAFGNRYRCKCGATTQKFYHGLACPVCGEKVEFKDDNFQCFGYICLKDPYYIIHPNLFMSLSFFIGEKDFNAIIESVNKKDEDGYEIEYKRPKDEPFYGIGMIDFHDRFDEVMEYYLAKKPNKRDYYEDIMNNRDKVFIQSIPVYTTALRPYHLDGGSLHFEGTNAIYNMMASLASKINDDKTSMSKKKKPKDQLLYNLQKKYKELYEELLKIISGKKGSIRTLFGGRLILGHTKVCICG